MSKNRFKYENNRPPSNLFFIEKDRNKSVTIKKSFTETQLISSSQEERSGVGVRRQACSSTSTTV